MQDNPNAGKDNSSSTFLLLEMNSEIPLYQQIRDQVVIAMAEGHLAQGDPLPTTRQLAIDFGINFHTVNKAYDVLRREGFVSLTRKQGTFVRQAPEENVAAIADWQNRLRTLLAEALARGLPPDEILGRCQVALDSFTPARTGANNEPQPAS